MCSSGTPWSTAFSAGVRPLKFTSPVSGLVLVPLECSVAVGLRSSRCLRWLLHPPSRATLRPLPSDAVEDNIKSVMSNGVLKIKIGKKSPKNINVDDEQNA